MKRTHFPFHPLLLCIYPILYLYADNIKFIQWEDTLASFALSLGVTVFFLLSFRVVLKRWEKAGLITTLLVVMFFAFGHLWNLVECAALGLSAAAMGWAWLALFLVLMFVIMRAKISPTLTLYLNLVGMILVLFPLLAVGADLFATLSVTLGNEREKLSELRGETAAEATVRGLAPGQLPDIYYIILDSYERADHLKNLYGFDNSEFVQALEARDFTVLPASRSNYLNTTYSLNTAFNLVYFSDFPNGLMKQSKANLRTNYLNDFLRKAGYQIVVFDSGTGDSNFQYADHFISPVSAEVKNEPVINPFETLLLRTTIAAILFEGSGEDDTGGAMAETVNRELDLRRERITHALDHLPDYAGQDVPHFLFAHIYLPHRPFLYGEGGVPLQYNENTGLYWYEPQPETYVEQYLDQIEYLNIAVLPTIDKILAESTRPVVIILQSDHGDDHFLDWDAPDARGVDVRSSTLSAIYFSDGADSSIDPGMSTVNTFRVVLNHWFGTSYPILPNRVYLHEHSATTNASDIARFIDACEAFGLCLSGPGQ